MQEHQQPPHPTPRVIVTHPGDTTPHSKRNVVVRNPLIPRRLLSRLRPLRRPRHRHRPRARALTTIPAAPAEQDHLLGNHLREVLLLPVFVVVAARLEPALHINLLALEQVIGDILLPPENDVRPVGLFLPFTRLLVLPPPLRRDG